VSDSHLEIPFFVGYKFFGCTRTIYAKKKREVERKKKNRMGSTLLKPTQKRKRKRIWHRDKMIALINHSILGYINGKH
jgi:hypothetical protein